MAKSSPTGPALWRLPTPLLQPLTVVKACQQASLLQTISGSGFSQRWAFAAEEGPTAPGPSSSSSSSSQGQLPGAGAGREQGC